MAGIIKLLDPLGKIVRQASYQGNSQKKSYIEKWEKLYPAHILKKCSYECEENKKTPEQLKEILRLAATHRRAVLRKIN